MREPPADTIAERVLVVGGGDGCGTDTDNT